MKKFSLLVFIFTTLQFFAQQKTTSSEGNHVSRTYYYDKVVSIEYYWHGNNKIMDSIKTYYPNGNKNELFYYKNRKIHGNCYQYNLVGEKIVTWKFDNGKLIERIDHKIEFHENNEEIILKAHITLEKASKILKEKPNSLAGMYNQVNARYKLGNTTLALIGFRNLEKHITKLKEKNLKKLPPNIEANIYDCLGSIYGGYEQENRAIHYKYKAIKTSPNESRLYYNFGAYLSTIKAYRLAQIYLNKTLEFSKNHAFANWGLANVYSDLEQYEKAMSCIEIAFKRQSTINKLNSGKAERDLHTTRGYLYHKLGNTEEGILDLKKALELNPNNSFAMRYLSEVYYDLEQYSLSCEYLQKARDLGYEKRFDRNDLAYFLSYSCNHKTSDKSLSFTQLPYAYPNPTIDKITIKNITTENFNYKLFNYNNQLVLSGIAKNNSIDLSNLSSGLYILTFMENEKVHSLKIIKK